MPEYSLRGFEELSLRFLRLIWVAVALFSAGIGGLGYGSAASEASVSITINKTGLPSVRVNMSSQCWSISDEIED